MFAEKSDTRLGLMLKAELSTLAQGFPKNHNPRLRLFTSRKVSQKVKSSLGLHLFSY